MGPEWIVVGVIAVAVLFGAKKIPEIARSVGRAQGEFKKGMKEGVVDEEVAPPGPTPTDIGRRPVDPAAEPPNPADPQAQG
jgi:sec-independent protein translocase protein TatA